MANTTEMKLNTEKETEVKTEMKTNSNPLTLVKGKHKTYWMDSNKNKWSAQLFEKYEAQLYSDKMVNSLMNINCTDGVKDSSYNVDCNNITDCVGCHNVCYLVSGRARGRTKYKFNRLTVKETRKLVMEIQETYSA